MVIVGGYLERMSIVIMMKSLWNSSARYNTIIYTVNEKIIEMYFTFVSYVHLVIEKNA